MLPPLTGWTRVEESRGAGGEAHMLGLAVPSVRMRHVHTLTAVE